MVDAVVAPELNDKSSAIVVVFNDVGSAQFTVQMNNVTAIQLLTIAGYLKIKAESAIIEAEKPKIAIGSGSPDMYPDLFRTAR